MELQALAENVDHTLQMQIQYIELDGDVFEENLDVVQEIHGFDYVQVAVYMMTFIAISNTYG